jgi:hypothetical protein
MEQGRRLGAKRLRQKLQLPGLQLLSTVYSCIKCNHIEEFSTDKAAPTFSARVQPLSNPRLEQNVKGR